MCAGTCRPYFRLAARCLSPAVSLSFLHTYAPTLLNSAVMQATAAAAAPADLKQAADFSRRPATRTTTTLATRASAGTVVDLKTEVCMSLCL